MHKFLVSLFFVVSINAFAKIDFEVLDHCDGSAKHASSIESEFLHVGEASIYFLNNLSIEYVGNQRSIVSIEGTPSGSGAIISHGNFTQYYGWCYLVDGVGPELMADEYELTDNLDHKIQWYFGYALRLNDQWLTQCTPAWRQNPPFTNGFCQSK